MVIIVRFTVVEFDTMVNELLYKDPISFDMLCHIAEKTLRPSVVKWCTEKGVLRGRGYEDDIMQEIYLRLMKTTVDCFLLREDVVGPYNNDPGGFEKWMFSVAKNIKRDFANKVRNVDFKMKDMDDPAIEEIPDDDYDDSEDHVERLKQAFSIVLSSDISIYKVLTWLAQFVFILANNVSKITSNEMVIDVFENKTLYDMYYMILVASQKIPWIVVAKEQNEKILSALRKKRIGDVSYGETKYKDFFMKHDGESSGKKSISDWVNRINAMIRRKVEEEAGSSGKYDKVNLN